METVVMQAQDVVATPLTAKERLVDIYREVSWLCIAKTYFGKSSTWMYNKLSGIDGNGKTTDFTEEEKAQLKGALCDLADRIRKASDSL